MSLFGKKEKAIIKHMAVEMTRKDKRIRQLEKLCAEKDSYFMELMADGLRHGSSLAAKHMADRKSFLNGK